MTKKAQKFDPVPIVVAVITTLGAIIVTYWQFVWKPSQEIAISPSPQQISCIGRVIDSNTQVPIDGAKVSFDSQGAPRIVYTDAEGIFRFIASFVGPKLAGHVRVEATGYQGYDRFIELSPQDTGLEDIRLRPLPLASTSTPTPSPPPTNTPTHTPEQPTIDTPTPSPAPTSACPTPSYFQDVWEMHPQLGCPINALTSDFTFQTFEKGILAWQKSPTPSTVYAFYDNGRWERQIDPGGPPHPSCPEAEQTNGLGPIFSFGTLWCEPWNWKEQLGMPKDREKDGKNNRIQNFENGTILTIGSASGFILYSDSHWEPF
jgi:hypothetical protein